ncbi:hypothetical protein BPUN_3492 [Candidatus Paraburkholderia kirkii]|nr:hypothetical protein BPUN_3492 [Candidatus Paraburkholderia kirkii]
MLLFDSQELVVVSRETLERMAACLEEAEQELDKHLFEESLAWFRSQGYTEDKCLSPADLVDEAPYDVGHSRDTRAGNARKPYVEERTQGSKPSFFEAFASLFAKRTKQFG